TGRFVARIIGPQPLSKPPFINRETGRRMTVEDMQGRCLDISDILLLKAQDEFKNLFNQRQERETRIALPNLRYPYVRQIWAVWKSAWSLEVRHHNGQPDFIPVIFGYTGLGPKARDGGEWHRAPRLVCGGCKTGHRKLFFDDRFGCRFGCILCLGLSNVSHQCSKAQRPVWQGIKIDARIARPGTHKKTIRRLEAKKRALPKRRGRVTERLSRLRDRMR